MSDLRNDKKEFAKCVSRPTSTNEGPVLMTPGMAVILNVGLVIMLWYVGGTFIMPNGSRVHKDGSTSVRASYEPLHLHPQRSDDSDIILADLGGDGNKTKTAPSMPCEEDNALPSNYEVRCLFGGAIACAIPTSFEDVSVVRQVSLVFNHLICLM